jgi:hypothetical protein
MATVGTSQFTTALAQFFNIIQCAQPNQTGCVPAAYTPAAVIIVEVPFVQAVNTLFGSTLQGLQSLGLGTSTLLNSSSVSTTASGYLNLAFTVSQNNNNNSQLLQDLLTAISSDLAAVIKTPDSKKLVSVLQDQLQVILDLGDLTVNVITDDLNQPGSLGSQTVLDFYGVQKSLSGLLQLSSVEMKLFDISEYGIQCAFSALLADPAAILPAARLAVTTFDIGVDLIPNALPSLQNSTLYSWFKTAVDVTTTFVDPPGTTIVPSFYDSNGLLVLGYNPQDGTINYGGISGILFQAGDGYLALLAEDLGNPSNFTETLVGLGASVPMPYRTEVRSYNRNQIQQEYSGMLPGGSSVSIPIQVDASNGALIPQVYLDPLVTVQQNGNSLSLTTKALLSDGSPTTATQAFLILNGQQYPMVQQDSSTFTITATNNAATSSTATTYVISSGVPGGFAATALGPRMGISMNLASFAGQPVGTTSNAQSIGFADTGTSGLTIFSFSIQGPAASDFTLAAGTTCPTGGGSLGTGTNCIINLTFAPSSVGTRTASLFINDNAPGSPHAVGLIGTGAPGAPAVSWPAPAPITYGMALGPTQLDATANVPGTFAYNPPVGSVINAGSQILSVNFIPTDATDYVPTNAQVTLTVRPAALSVITSGVMRAYGQANPALNSVTYSGFVNRDGTSALGGTLNCATTATQTSPVGTYPITCSGLISSNYTIVFVPGTLTITKATATIAANNLTKTMNAPNPTLTWTASGFANGENASVLTTQPTCTTTAITTSPAGSYPITCSGAAAANYAFSYVPGTLTVGCHYVSITFSPSSVALGSLITINGKLMSCASTTQVVVVQFVLTGPLQPGTCGKADAVMFKTPPFALPPKTLQTVSFPYRIPKASCPGGFTISATTFVNGKAVDTSSASLTVTAH